MFFFAAPPFSLLLSEFAFVFSRFRSVEQGFPALGSPTSFYTPLNCCCSLLLLSGLEPFRLKSVIKITRECYSVFFAKLWPLRAKREERGGRAARLLTPAGLALPGYNWGRSQLAFRQREYLAPRAARFIFARVKRSTLRGGVHPTFAGTELRPLTLCVRERERELLQFIQRHKN